MNCKICGERSHEIFTKQVLHKYQIKYYQCSNCHFIQTEEPYWLNEAYEDAINTQDIGLIYRNQLFAEILTAFFRLCGFEESKSYLDYGGGYGMFVRMMRDRGFNFFWSDKFCENIYASKFSIEEPFNKNAYFDSITAFEVFEHLTDPTAEIEKLLSHTDSLLFSTELVGRNSKNVENWWYIMPEHGQHIAFYDKRTLEYIASKYNLNLYSNNSTLHFLTKKRINKIIYKFSSSYRFSKIYNSLFPPKSLLERDYKLYLEN